MLVLGWLLVKRHLAGLGHRIGLRSWVRGLEFGGTE